MTEVRGQITTAKKPADDHVGRVLSGIHSVESLGKGGVRRKSGEEEVEVVLVGAVGSEKGFIWAVVRCEGRSCFNGEAQQGYYDGD